MRKTWITLFLGGLLWQPAAQAQVKILFDCTKAETDGNADWTIDADLHNMNWNPNACVGCGNESNPQRTPTPAQSGITSTTAETYWTGSLSYWGTDCVKKGYVVETLPCTGQITYGSTSNVQDLSHYNVYIVDEPNILFTTAEKAAIMNFVYNGGSLFIISDHDQSDRNNDGYDSPAIWNDFITNNGVHNNATGFTFNLLNFSQTSTNIPSLPGDSILHGPMGNVTQVLWTNGTSMTLNTSQNSTVKGVIFQTGASTVGTQSVMCAYSHVGCGKVAAIGDSSPPDDGTGDPNDQLYNGYIQDASGNHQKLLMNITMWLAAPSCNVLTGVNELSEAAAISLYPNPASTQVSIHLPSADAVPAITLTDLYGKTIDVAPLSAQPGEYTLNTGTLANGIYFCHITVNGNTITKKLMITR